MPMVEERPQGKGISKGDRVLALFSFSVALLLLRLPLWLIVKVVRLLKRLPERSATLAEAERMQLAIRYMARYYPGRAACLEVSLATFILGALKKQRITWCMGAKFSPLVTHTWVEVSGQPISEKEGGEYWPYQAIIRE